MPPLWQLRLIQTGTAITVIASLIILSALLSDEFARFARVF